MEHKYLTSETCGCDPDEYCLVCSGGLAVCAVCSLAEGALTTECPGEESMRLHGEQVYRGDEDFVGGCWQTGRSSPHSPASYASRR